MGCYDDIKEGYVNLDKKKYFEGIDVVHDLEKFPYPFEDNEFDEVIARYILDHLDRNKLREVFNELHRICKDRGIIKITVSYDERYMRCFDHKGGFSFFTFLKLEDEKRKWKSDGNWKIKEMHGIPVSYGFAKYIPNFKIKKHLGLRDTISLYLKGITNDVYVELKVIK